MIERAAEGVEIVWDNTTRAVGDHPDSKLPADLAHVRRVLAREKPAVVLSLGRQAAETLAAVWTGPLLIVPHPTYRLLTNRLYDRAGRLLSAGFCGTVELVQLQGRYQVRRSDPLGGGYGLGEVGCQSGVPAQAAGRTRRAGPVPLRS